MWASLVDYYLVIETYLYLSQREFVGSCYLSVTFEEGRKSNEKEPLAEFALNLDSVRIDGYRKLAHHISVWEISKAEKGKRVLSWTVESLSWPLKKLDYL